MNPSPYEMEKKLIKAKLAAADGEKNNAVKAIEKALVEVCKAHHEKEEEEEVEALREARAQGS